MKEKKVPAIRFQGFTDDWEQRKLGEVADVYDGVHQTPIYQDSGIMFLSVENISTLTSNKFISEEAFERDYKNYPEKGDILMTRIGDVGTPNVVETAEKVAFYVSLALLKPKDTDSFFLCNTIRSTGFQKGLRNRTLVTAIPQKINKDEIGKVEFQMPTNPDEPKKIGIYFKILDHLIALHQRKLTKLHLLKKSMLTKMFPKDGARVPEIRFQGFHGDWKEQRLSKLAEVKDSARIPNSLWASEGVPYIRASDLTNDDLSGTLFLSSDTFSFYKNRTGAPEKGDVLFNGGGEIGKALLKPDDSDIYVQGGAVLYVKTSHAENLSGEYLTMYFQSPFAKDYINIAQAGGTMKHFTLQPAQDMPIVYPSDEEQHKIGVYFQHLDNLYAIHQRKLSKLQQIKQAMLSKLFV